MNVLGRDAGYGPGCLGSQFEARLWFVYTGQPTLRPVAQRDGARPNQIRHNLGRAGVGRSSIEKCVDVTG